MDFAIAVLYTIALIGYGVPFGILVFSMILPEFCDGSGDAPRKAELLRARKIIESAMTDIDLELGRFPKAE